MSKHTKMMLIKGLSGSQEFSKYQDDINSLMIAKNGNGDFLLQNPDGLSSKISAMNTSGSGNPFQIGGHDFEIERASGIANKGKKVRLDPDGLPDVLDDTDKEAYQCKKMNGPGTQVNGLGTKAKEAVNQIKPTGIEPAPPNYSKNVVIKNNNPNNPHFNASEEDLIEYLKKYNIYGPNPDFPEPSGALNGMKMFIILNNKGEHEILGSLIDI